MGVQFRSSDSAKTIAFTRNPSHPRTVSDPQELLVTQRAADGTVHVQSKGRSHELALTWSPQMPMTADDFRDGASGENLVDFYQLVHGTEDWFTFVDDDASEVEAHFASEPEFSEVAHGFAGTVTLHVAPVSP